MWQLNWSGSGEWTVRVNGWETNWRKYIYADARRSAKQACRDSSKRRFRFNAKHKSLREEGMMGKWHGVYQRYAKRRDRYPSNMIFIRSNNWTPSKTTLYDTSACLTISGKLPKSQPASYIFFLYKTYGIQQLFLREHFCYLRPHWSLSYSTPPHQSYWMLTLTGTGGEASDCWCCGEGYYRRSFMNCKAANELPNHSVVFRQEEAVHT